MAASRCGSNQAQSLTSGTSQWSHRRDDVSSSHQAEKLRNYRCDIPSPGGISMSPRI